MYLAQKGFSRPVSSLATHAETSQAYHHDPAARGPGSYLCDFKPTMVRVSGLRGGPFWSCHSEKLEMAPGARSKPKA